MSLIETSELEKIIDKVKIIDCSWHMPQANRNGDEEFKNQHIPNAIFFDLDKNSKKETDLPHMLVGLNDWEEIVSNMGISNDDEIIIYDNENQKEIAEKVLDQVNKKFSGKVVTKISRIYNYCRAEEYHQKYLEKN